MSHRVIAKTQETGSLGSVETKRRQEPAFEKGDRIHIEKDDSIALRTIVDALRDQHAMIQPLIARGVGRRRRIVHFGDVHHNVIHICERGPSREMHDSARMRMCRVTPRALQRRRSDARRCWRNALLTLVDALPIHGFHRPFGGVRPTKKNLFVIRS